MNDMQAEMKFLEGSLIMPYDNELPFVERDIYVNVGRLLNWNMNVKFTKNYCPATDIKVSMKHLALTH